MEMNIKCRDYFETEKNRWWTFMCIRNYFINSGHGMSNNLFSYISTKYYVYRNEK